MPLYEYECFVCHRRFQRIQKVSATPVEECPGCGGKVRRLLGVPALQFKGTGWYVTDYGKGNGSSGRTTTNGDSPSPSTASSEISAPAKADTSDNSSSDSKSTKPATS